MKTVSYSHIKGEYLCDLQNIVITSGYRHPVITIGNKLLVFGDATRLGIIQELELPGKVISHFVRTFYNKDIRTNNTVNLFNSHFFIICESDNEKMLLSYKIKKTKTDLIPTTGLVLELLSMCSTEGVDPVFLCDRKDRIKPIIYVQTKDRKTLIGYDVQSGTEVNRLLFEKPIIVRKEINNSDDRLRVFDGEKQIIFNDTYPLPKSGIQTEIVYQKTYDVNIEEIICDSRPVYENIKDLNGYYDGNNCFFDEETVPRFSLDLIDMPLQWTILPASDGLYWHCKYLSNGEPLIVKLDDKRYHTLSHDYMTLTNNYGRYFVYREDGLGYIISCISVIPLHRFDEPEEYEIYWTDFQTVYEKPLGVYKLSMSGYQPAIPVDAPPDVVDSTVVIVLEDTIRVTTLKDIHDHSKLIHTSHLKKDTTQ